MNIHIASYMKIIGASLNEPQQVNLSSCLLVCLIYYSFYGRCKRTNHGI